jgi:hypothetical protein
MNNNYLVINSNNGISSSFGPGHIKNGIISENIKDLLENYRTTSLQEWKNEIYKVFELCQYILEKKY